MRPQLKKRLPKSPERALEILRWMSSKMERSVSQVRASLYRWQVDPSEHQKIIDTLIEEKFIDERRYTRAFISEKLRSANWGTAKITYALRVKNIAPDIIKETLDELLNPHEMAENLHEQLSKKYKFEQRREPDKYKLKSKLYRWAASRGYDSTDIVNTLDKIFNDEDF